MRISLLAGLVSLLFTANAAAPANPYIAAGKSLGNIELNISSDSLAWLGPASYGDAAMQKAWSTWYSKPEKPGAVRHQIDVYTVGVGPDLHKEVQMVRATSPWFRTVDGMRVGSTLAQVKNACGPLTLATIYRLTPRTAPRYLYDNARAGITFETVGQAATSRCTAIIVHLPGQKVTGTYLSLTEYLKGAQQQATAAK